VVETAGAVRQAGGEVVDLRLQRADTGVALVCGEAQVGVVLIERLIGDAAGGQVGEEIVALLLKGQDRRLVLADDLALFAQRPLQRGDILKPGGNCRLMGLNFENLAANLAFGGLKIGLGALHAGFAAADFHHMGGAQLILARRQFPRGVSGRVASSARASAARRAATAPAAAQWSPALRSTQAQRKIHDLFDHRPFPPAAARRQAVFPVRGVARSAGGCQALRTSRPPVRTGSRSGCR
jgi:hypothetical protein